MGWRLDHIARRVDRRRAIAVAPRRMVILEPVLVTSQPLLDPHRGLIGARIGVRRVGVGVQGHAGIKMDRAFGVEAEALLLHRHMPGISAVEILAQRLRDTGAHALAQGFADVEVFSRDAKWHRLPPLSQGPWKTGRCETIRFVLSAFYSS